MKKMAFLRSTILVVVHCSILLTSKVSFAQINKSSNIDTVEANDAYTFLDELGQSIINRSFRSIDPIIRAMGFAYEERRNTMYRELGIKLWGDYPTDSRKFQWFRQSFSGNGYSGNHYWLNIDSASYTYKRLPSMFDSYSAPMDWLSLQKMEKRYPKMRTEYFKYLDSTVLNLKDRALLKSSVYEHELSAFLKLSRNRVYRNGGKINLGRLKELFVTAGEILKQIDWKKLDGRYLGTLYTMDNDFISIYKQYDLDIEDIKAFLQSLSGSDNPAIQEWVRQKRSLLALGEEPLILKKRAIDGRLVDLKQLRGKVVLVDFWSTSCSSCIARMPAIKEIYDKYKHQGFEVISACYNYGDEKVAIEKLEKKIGADWPIILIGGETKKDFSNSIGSDLWKKYGFMGVPQLLLLDKNGKLVMLNDILRSGDFEPLVKELLTQIN